MEKTLDMSYNEFMKLVDELSQSASIDNLLVMRLVALGIYNFNKNTEFNEKFTNFINDSARL